MNKNPSEKQISNRDYEITVEGSLGLLALGAKGIDLWRKKKAEVKNSSDTLQVQPDSPNEKK